MSDDHPIVLANREAKAERLANAVRVLHKALYLNRLVPKSVHEYASNFPQPVWAAIGRAIGEKSEPKTSIPIALSLLADGEQECLREAV